MSRIVVYSMCYRGDVFPYAPVAAELARRGHDVTFLAPAELLPSLEAEGVTLADADAGEMCPSGLDRYGEYCARWGKVASGALLMPLYYRRLTVPRLDPLLDAIDAVADGADLLLTHPGAAPIASMPFERRGIPFMVGDLFPMLVRTSDHPPEGLVPFRTGTSKLARRANDLAWNAGRSPMAKWCFDEKRIVAKRQALGLPIDGWHVMDGRLSPSHNMAMVSPHYYPPASDWGEEYPFVGFTHWTRADDELPPDVAEFLRAGDPPVLVCLGTSAASAAPEVFDHAAHALDELGLRGMYLASNDAIAARLGDRPGVWPFVPVGPVLPHVRAVVHAGAHGMNSLVLAAGTPSVVVPVLFDQLWHARRHTQLGTGRHVRGRVTVSKLRTAIEAVLADDTEARAREFASLLAAEDGTNHACDRIEAVLHAG
ncbi:MAG: glycosyltransferase family 1 protein [Acidimicrobiia bacterium]|nr:glycosyltransferase family 1 protein [Acidimicrobiia bacterium]